MIRMCSRKINVRVFENNFGEYKAQIYRHDDVRKMFKISSRHNLPKRRALYFYVNRQ